MSRDIFTSLSGARNAYRQLEVLSNDVANLNTVGYKRQRMSFEQVGLGEGLLGQPRTQAAGFEPDLRDGALLTDENPTHLALRGRGFFALTAPASPAGGALLTRAGDFHLDAEGFLTTPGGMRVLGDNGPVQLPLDERFSIAADGVITGERSGVLGRVLVVDAVDPRPIGQNLWQAVGPLPEAQNVMIQQGALESSNVEPARAMVELIEASRMFEFYQRAIQISDQMDGQLINLNRRNG